MSTKPHNPDNLTPEKIGTADGWRLLDKDECGGLIPRTQYFDTDDDCWSRDGSWFCSGEDGDGMATLRTRLTRSELRAARGLTPEPMTPTPDNQPDTPAPAVGSETPRTDVSKFDITLIGANGTPQRESVVYARISRKLERELTTERARADALAVKLAQAEQERDEARKVQMEILDSHKTIIRAVQQSRDDHARNSVQFEVKWREALTQTTQLQAEVERLRQDKIKLRNAIYEAWCELEGYVDGAPDASPFSKTANSIAFTFAPFLTPDSVPVKECAFCKEQPDEIKAKCSHSIRAGLYPLQPESGATPSTTAQAATGGETPTPEYDPQWMDKLPNGAINTATSLHHRMKMAGFDKWQLGPVADRAVVWEQEKQITALRHQLAEAVKEIESRKQQLRVECEDWAEFHTYLQEHGIQMDAVDSYSGATCLIDGIKQVVAERDQQAAQLRELRITLAAVTEYAVHSPACAFASGPREMPCDCGLDELLATLNP